MDGLKGRENCAKSKVCLVALLCFVLLCYRMVVRTGNDG